MKNLQYYLEQFYSDGEVLISDQAWTDEFERAFREELTNKNIAEIRIYRAVKHPNHKLICRLFHHPKMEIEQMYSERSIFQLWFPPLILVFIYFLAISILAVNAESMLTQAFLLYLPFSIGALVEYVSSLHRPRRALYTFFRQIILVAVLLLLGLIVLGEGIICLIMAAPIFLICSSLGAFLMRWCCRKLWRPYKKLYSIGLLPLIALLLFPDLGQYQQGMTRQELIINAPIEELFTSINHIQNIQPNEVKHSPIFTMGFPKPLSGMTVNTKAGLIRQIEWQRGIHFQEKIIRSEAPYKLMWTYIFTPQSFPKGSLDDHLEMGGAYFNLLTTDYELQAINQHQTRLILQIDYRLSTEVNWYADLWVRYVLNEFSDVVLHIYKNRLENSQTS